MVQGVLCPLTGRAAFLFRGNVDFSIGSTIPEDAWTTGKPQTPEAKKRV